MKLSNKMKTELKKILAGAMTTIAVLVLVFVCSQNMFVETQPNSDIAAIVSNNSAIGGNIRSQADVIKDSSGIHVGVNAEESNGVRRIEILQNDTSIAVYNYDGSCSIKNENVQISVPFGTTSNIKVKVNGSQVYDENVENMSCISNIADLCAFRDIVNAGNRFEGKYVEITDDIDMSSACSSSKGSWYPIGMTNTNFGGTFNGNFHKIKNLYINVSDSTDNYPYYGLFRATYNQTCPATIENVILDGGSVTVSSTNAKYSLVGALIGEIYYGRIINCSSNVNVSNTSASQAECGGITGAAQYGEVFGCVNYGTITCKNGGNRSLAEPYGYAGGIAGAVVNSIVHNCYNRGNISISRTGSIWNCSGGIAGELVVTTKQGDGLITKCYNTGSITGSTQSVGSICGQTYDAITYCCWLNISPNKVYGNVLSGKWRI